MKKLAILGATGSIGASTFSVCRSNPGLYQITLLAASTSVDKMFSLCQEFSPLYVSMSSETAAKQLRELLKKANLSSHVLENERQLLQLLASEQVDSVMAAIVGAAGLKTTLAAVNAGKEVFLANKEALV
ncbi:MAG TPA: 1-deoxy-D-xylulose-5-phosphate reductoisomerase, partial [Psychromonas sp.]